MRGHINRVSELPELLPCTKYSALRRTVQIAIRGVVFMTAIRTAIDADLLFTTQT